jgi:predicted transport protein
LNVVPQVKRLCPSLNMLFADLDDPKVLAKSVTGIGWGNGDVELDVATLAEMFYAMGLIRQP